MVNIVLVFVGGALGAMLRELIILMVPHMARGFPLDILVANLVAAFLIGLLTALHNRGVMSDSVIMFLGTGTCGGLSTFAALAWGAVVLRLASAPSAVVASAYVVTSLVLGYLAVIVGLKLGGPPKSRNGL